MSNPYLLRYNALCRVERFIQFDWDEIRCQIEDPRAGAGIYKITNDELGVLTMNGNICLDIMQKYLETTGPGDELVYEVKEVFINSEANPFDWSRDDLELFLEAAKNLSASAKFLQHFMKLLLGSVDSGPQNIGPGLQHISPELQSTGPGPQQSDLDVALDAVDAALRNARAAALAMIQRPRR